LQTLTTLAAKVFEVHGLRRGKLSEVLSLVGELSADMLLPMLKEEQVLFPYLTQLEQAALDGRGARIPFLER